MTETDDEEYRESGRTSLFRFLGFLSVHLYNIIRSLIMWREGCSHDGCDRGHFHSRGDGGDAAKYGCGGGHLYSREDGGDAAMTAATGVTSIRGEMVVMQP